MNLAAVMDEVGAALGGIAGLRVSSYPADSAQPPAAIVAFPEGIEFDETYGRGSDRMTLSVFLVIARVNDRTARDEMAPYAAGSGAQSVKAALDGAAYTACDSVRVTGVTFVPFTMSGVEYWAAEFSVDVYGQGA